MDMQDNNMGNQMLQRVQPQGISPVKLPKDNKGNKPKIEIIIAVILLIVAAIVIYIYNSKHLTTITPEIKPVQKQELNKVVVTAGLPAGVTLSPLPAGQLPADFPKDLIIYNSVQNIESSRNIIPNNELHLVVQFTVASSTPQQVANNYQNTLLAKKWKVVASGNYDKDYYVSMTAAGGITDAGTITVTVTPNATGSTASLDYGPLPK